MSESLPTASSPNTSASATGVAWPSPPYASYPAWPAGSSLPCEVTGRDGSVRLCDMTQFDPVQGTAMVTVPPSQVDMPLRLELCRRLVIQAPLAPVSRHDTTAPQALQALLSYRTRIPYQLTYHDGQQEQGHTIGHVQTQAGLFLYLPLDDQDRVQRVFVPQQALRDVQIGAAIGQVLVEQQALTPDQVELAAREQASLRQRKLGDYLVFRDIVKPEQLLRALEEQSRMPLVRIGEALTALGLISPAQLDEALKKQRLERGVPLGELLVQSGQLTREGLRTALAHKMGFPVVDLTQFPLDAEALRRVPLATARRLLVLPLLWQQGTLVVAADDPSRRSTIDELEFFLQAKVVTALAGTPVTPDSIAQAYQRFGLDDGTAPASTSSTATGPTAPPAADAGELLQSLEQGASDDEDSASPIAQSDNSLVRLINTLIIDAYQQGASDIHIETYPSRRKVRVRLRKDGRLVPVMELPHTYRAAVVARLKIMSDLDISERRKPQDGKIDFSRFSPSHKLELRVSTIPTTNGAEDVVLRLLSSAQPVPLDQLQLSPPHLQGLLQAIQRPHGLVLCVGPTGSGKTTTLHSLLQHINTPDRKIWTAEDPIEITNPDLRQVQVNPKIEWTFAKALRAFLRADPDVIMVGEVRDADTAQVTVEASLTGHLVLSTLHTNSAPETVVRLLDMGLDPFNFADSLVAVLAQRLVRRLCPQCVQTEVAPEAWVEELLADYLHHFPDGTAPDASTLRADWLQRHGQQGRLLRHHAPGCPSCDHTGHKGRVGVHELLTVDATMRRLIQRKATSEALQQAAMARGDFLTLRQDGIQKVLQGLTSIEEVRAQCSA